MTIYTYTMNYNFHDPQPTTSLHGHLITNNTQLFALIALNIALVFRELHEA